MNNFFSPEPGQWYQNLAKPSWTPDPSTIGTIWGILYPTIIIGFVAVCVKVYQGVLPKTILAIFGVNILANLFFTPIQFGLRNLPLAWLDILLVWVTCLSLVVILWNKARWIAVLLIPYLVWVSIASVIQTYITFMN